MGMLLVYIIKFNGCILNKGNLVNYNYIVGDRFRSHMKDVILEKVYGIKFTP